MNTLGCLVLGFILGKLVTVARVGSFISWVKSFFKRS